jgi:hypothetical protein
MIKAVFAIGSIVVSGVAGVPPSVVLAAQPNGQVLNVTVTSSRVSLTAHEAPLGEVLTAIGQQAGVKIVLTEDLDTPVTETLVDVPLDAAIQQLTRWHSVLFIYEEPGAVREENLGLTEVWVMSGAVGAAVPEGRPHDVRAGGALPDVPRRGARNRGLNRGEVADDLRQLATTDPSPRVRQIALQKLARQPGVDGVKEPQRRRDPRSGAPREASGHPSPGTNQKRRGWRRAAAHAAGR